MLHYGAPMGVAALWCTRMMHDRMSVIIMFIEILRNILFFIAKANFDSVGIMRAIALNINSSKHKWVLSKVSCNTDNNYLLAFRLLAY